MLNGTGGHSIIPFADGRSGIGGSLSGLLLASRLRDWAGHPLRVPAIENVTMQMARCKESIDIS